MIAVEAVMSTIIVLVIVMVTVAVVVIVRNLIATVIVIEDSNSISVGLRVDSSALPTRRFPRLWKGGLGMAPHIYIYIYK